MSGRSTSSWYGDLLLVAALAVVAGAVAVAPGTPRAVDWIVGVPLLIFLPGYAVVSLAFPEAAPDAEAPESAASRTPDWPMFLGFAVATSVLLVAVVGTALAAVGELALSPAVAAIVAATVVAAGAAALRRRATAPAFRRAPFANGLLGGTGGPELGSRRQTLALAVAVVVLVAAAGAAAGFDSPTEDEAFTEFAVLEETDDGELVAGGYPDEIGTAEGHTFDLMLENHEGHAESYTVVVVAQRVENGSVTSQTRLNETTVEVADGQRKLVEQTVAPERVGEDVRVQFLLYKGDAPETASPDSADVALQVWTDFVSGYPDATVDPPTASGASAPSVAAAERVAEDGSVASADQVAHDGAAPTSVVAVEPSRAGVRVAAPAR